MVGALETNTARHSVRSARPVSGLPNSRADSSAFCPAAADDGLPLIIRTGRPVGRHRRQGSVRRSPPDVQRRTSSCTRLDVASAATESETAGEECPPRRSLRQRNVKFKSGPAAPPSLALEPAARRIDLALHRHAAARNKMAAAGRRSLCRSEAKH